MKLTQVWLGMKTLGPYIRFLSEPKRRNFAASVLSFLSGQGSIFLAQSYLLVSSQTDLLGEFGIAFLLQTLLIQIADWGGQTVIARETVTHTLGSGMRAYYLLSRYRLRIAILVSLIVITALQFSTWGMPVLTRNYLMVSVWAMIPHSRNMYGLFDGMGHSGLTGASISVPFIATSVSLPICATFSRSDAGFALGSVFLVSSLLSLTFQLYVFRLLSGVASVTQVSDASTNTSNPKISLFVEGAACLLTTIPGQLFYRMQVAAAGLGGAGAVGVFIYAKQVVSGLMQLTMFARRVELREFAVATSNSQKIPFTHIFRSWSVILSALFVTLSFLTAFLAGRFDWQFKSVPWTIYILSPTILSNAVCLLCIQWLIYKNRSTEAVLVTVIPTIVGGGVVFPATSAFGLAGTASTEIGIHLVQIGIILYLASNPFPLSAVDSRPNHA